MSGLWVPPGKQRFVDPATGVPLAGASVYHYVPGTSTPKDTFADQAETTLNQNPVILDASGECIIWGEGLYRQVVIDVNGVTQWDQVTGMLISAGSVTFASPAEVLAGVRNDVVVSPYALANSGVLTVATATGAQTAAGTLNNVYVTPYALAQSALILPVASAAEVAALTTNVKVITPKGLGDSGVLGGSGSAFPAITSFSFVGDGVTDNQSHVAAVLASTSSLIYMPDGTYFIGGDGPTQRAKLQRRFWGPGKFLFADGFLTPGRFSMIGAAPSPWPTTGASGWFNGDTRAVEPEWHILGPGVRRNLTGNYFNAGVLPHNWWYYVQSGESGLITMASGGLLAGATSAALVSVDGITVGTTLGVSPYGMDSAQTDVIVVDTIVGTTITFHNANPLITGLSTNYPNISPDGVNPGRATFMLGKRTWAGLLYMLVQNQPDAGGDVYGAIARLTNGYIAHGGQRHFFNTSTVGCFGGSIAFTATANGAYGTGWENQAADAGADVAYFAFVDSFSRQNENGAWGGIWGGHTYQSGGPMPADVMHICAGHWRFGADFTRATLEDSTSNTVAIVAGTSTLTLASAAGLLPGAFVGVTNSSNVGVELHTVASVAGNVVTINGTWAANFTIGQRIYKQNAGSGMNMLLGQTAIIFNSTVGATGRSADPSGLYGTFYGNQTGDLMMYSGNDGTPVTSDFWAIGFNRPSPNNGRLRLRPTVLQCNTTFQAALNVESGAQLVCGGATPQVVFGPGLGAWIEREAATGRLRATSNNGGSFAYLT